LKENKGISLYWKLQITGWTVASLYWLSAAWFAGKFIWSIGIADLILDVTVGIGLTHMYRHFALKNKWHTLNLNRLLPRIAIAILILSLLYMVLITGKLYVIRKLLLQDPPTSFIAFFKSARLQVFITGTRLMAVWVLAYHMYHYSRRELETVKENARLLLIAKDAQLNKLAAQLNPHFFFNSLNNIKFLVAENPELARRAIDLLSEVLRNSLNNNADQLISVQDEINLVKDYLELEKMRFEDRLMYTIHFDQNTLQQSIPPLIIQTLVENAIKHGIEKRKDGGCIKVAITRENGSMNIRVQSTGILNNGSSMAGIGLNNLIERLNLQYNGHASFDLVQTDNATVLATIEIPAK
jgi:sensor histidine kinase YesM